MARLPTHPRTLRTRARGFPHRRTFKKRGIVAFFAEYVAFIEGAIAAGCGNFDIVLFSELFSTFLAHFPMHRRHTAPICPMDQGH